MNLKTERPRHEERGELLDDIELIQNLIEIEKSNLKMYKRNCPSCVDKCKEIITSMQETETGLIEQYLKLINIDSK